MPSFRNNSSKNQHLNIQLRIDNKFESKKKTNISFLAPELANWTNTGRSVKTGKFIIIHWIDLGLDHQTSYGEKFDSFVFRFGSASQALIAASCWNDFFGKNSFPQQTGLAFQYCTFFSVADAVQNYEKNRLNRLNKMLSISVPAILELGLRKLELSF